MSYSQPISKLAGFADRSGMHASNGRDIGVQLQGDFLKVNGRNLLHYQVGVFNGQGINTKDVDQQKDLIGGVWVMPVKGMRIGVFGSEGSYSRKGTWTNEQGIEQTGIRRLPQHRYAISGEYKFDDWTIRSEYVHSTGMAFAKAYEKAEDLSNCSVNEKLGSKADGVILVVGSGDISPDEARQAKALLEKGNVNILGVVLNKVPQRHQGGYYYYYYYDENHEKHKKQKS